MKSRSRRLLKKEKSSEESKPFFTKKSNRGNDNAQAGFFTLSGIQAKLKMGRAGDASEKQADAVADKVVSSPSKEGLLQRESSDNSSVNKADEKEDAAAKLELQKADDEEATAKYELQKADEEEGSAKYEVQKAEDDEGAAKLEVQKADDEEKAAAKFELNKSEEESQARFEISKAEDDEGAAKSEVQKKDDEEVSSQSTLHRKEEKPAKASFESRLKAAKTGGQSLPDKVKEEMEHKMGKDFSHVLIHTDDTAVALCREIKAQAFTNGYHIFFNKGKFNPESSSGKHLLAHELTHVVQQKM